MATKPQDMANAIRFLSIDAIDRANSGHPGMLWVWRMLLLFFSLNS